MVRKGDCLVGMDGNFTVAAWRGPLALLNQRVARLQWCSSQIESAFFALALQFELSELQGKKAYTTVDHLPGTQINDCVVPLPPLAEQKRIVAKVDELMGLCDRLEALEAERKDRHASLSRAALARSAASPTPTNLQFLFHKSYEIEPAEFKNAILDAAIRGTIVSQNSEQNSHEELKSIQDVRSELVKSNVAKKVEHAAEITLELLDHPVPPEWCWVRLAEICELITDGTHLTPKYTESGRPFLSAQNVKPFRFLPDVHRFVSEEHYQGYIKNRKPTKGDILLTRVGAGIGEAATIDREMDFPIYVSVGLIRPVRNLVFSDYITLWLNSPDGRRKSSRNTYGKGTSQGNLNLSLIRNFLVPLPPLA